MSGKPDKCSHNPDEQVARAEEWMACEFETDDENLVSVSEIAESQLVHALLVDRYESESDSLKHIDRYMESFKANKKLHRLPTKSKSALFQKKYFPLMGSIAASVFLFVAVFLVVLPSNSAIAAIDKVIEHIGDLGDRMYSLRVKSEAPNDDNYVTSSSKPSKPRFELAKLYLRGSNQYVLFEERYDDNGFIKGSNGQESWLIHGEERILTISDIAQGIKLPLSANSDSMISLNFADVLEELKDGYDLEIQHNQTISSSDGVWTKITANRIDQSSHGVKRVVLFYDSESFYIQRIVFSRVHLPGERDFRTIYLNLQSVASLPEDFFESHRHETGQRGRKK